MPTYDYKCVECGLQFEATHRINDAPPACPTCAGKCNKLILSPPAAHGYMAVGREQAMQSLQPKSSAGSHAHGPGCGCGHHHYAS